MEEHISSSFLFHFFFLFFVYVYFEISVIGVGLKSAAADDDDGKINLINVVHAQNMIWHYIKVLHDLKCRVSSSQ